MGSCDVSEWVMKSLILKSLAILAASILMALSFHFSFLLQGINGQLVIRPDLEENVRTISQKPRKITLAEAKKRFDEKTVVFVDARPQLFFQVGHIPKALSFPREEFEKNRDLAPLLPYKENILIVYCSGIDCPDSSLLAAYLSKAGFRHLEIFEGGWPAWQEAGYPIGKQF